MSPWHGAMVDAMPTAMPPPVMDQTCDAPQYDAIGIKYDANTTMFARLEHVNVRQAVEPLLRAEGDKAAVIDWGCGTGFYSQRLLGWGAASVTGVDVSSAMLAGAEARLAVTPFARRARFLRADGSQPRSFAAPGSDGFYMVTGIWFLNYAADPEQLTAMFLSVSLNLKPAGVFVGVCYDATDDVAACAAASAAAADQPVMRRVGVRLEYPEALDNGLGYWVHVFGSPPPGSDASARGVDFWTYHLKRSVSEEAARAGGMRGKLEWHNCAFVGDEWRRELGLDIDEGWRVLRETPQLSVLVLRKT